ncbi:hypothetical protein NDU88_004138 [Pleurodeles waltl]|uniref:Uncharacterized protein n=1 Tax=Pleurodeles waltl TaxID=8319 RepID=A0AAV7V0D5_PLEWA|nr:hypothetical protein NDU88_004127 [Pleurodeles waltl]KAJ1194853.1 hypothetical protein NDU88_004138 [Pleurodeles waltl]
MGRVGRPGRCGAPEGSERPCLPRVRQRGCGACADGRSGWVCPVAAWAARQPLSLAALGTVSSAAATQEGAVLLGPRRTILSI